jgi:hypothetical protein
VGQGWTNSGTFTDGSGKVTFTATSGTLSIDPGGDAFYDLTFGNAASTAEWDIGADIDIDGDLSIAYGTVDLTSAYNINTAGAVSISSGASYTKSTGTWTFDGTGSNNYTDSNGTKENLGNVKIDAESSTRTVALLSDIVMDNLTIEADGVFSMSTYDVQIGNTSTGSVGDINVTSGGSSSQSASGTVTVLSASGTTQWNGAGEFDAYNLTIGNGTTFIIDNETNDLVLDIANDFTISSSAEFQASSTANFNIKGSYTNSGTFTSNSGKVTLDDTDGGEQLSGTMTGSTGQFYDLEFNDGATSGAWSFQAAATITNDFTITGGSVTAPSGTLTIGGDFSNQDSFSHNSPRVQPWIMQGQLLLIISRLVRAINQ